MQTFTLKHIDMKKLLYYLAMLCLITGCSSKGDILDAELIPVKSGARFGYVNPKGQYQINPQFDEASFFRDGIALVKSNGRWGYIDKQGSYIINPTYQDATIFLEGVAWTIKKEGAPTAINKKGEELFCLKTAEKVYNFSEGAARYAVISPTDEGQYLYGYIDKKGETIIAPTYKRASEFKEGVAAVTNEKGEYGYINKKGELVINYQFEGAKDFHNGYAIVRNDNYQAGTIDKKGKFIIMPQFDQMIPDGDNYIVTLEGGIELGWCDNKGKLIINPQFDSAFPFHNKDIAPIALDDKFGYINRKGEIIINPQFKYALPFLNDYAIVFVNGKTGTIDKEGKYIINPQFNDIGGDILYDVLEKDMDDHPFYVTTDYFNINAITSAIQNIITKEKIENMDFSTTISRIMTNYSLAESSINKNRVFHLLKTTTPSPDATISLFMSGNFFDKVSDGWWGYNDVLNKNTSPNKFQIAINLKEKGYGKEEKVMMEILSSFEAKGQNIKEVDYGAFHMALSTERNKVIITITPTAPFTAFLRENSVGNTNIPKDKFIAEAPESISVEEQFKLTYTIRAEETKDFRIPTITYFDVLMGPTRSQKSNIITLNGEVTMINYITFTYILIPHDSGTFTIPGATIKADGKSYTSNSVTINVTPK